MDYPSMTIIKVCKMEASIITNAFSVHKQDIKDDNTKHLEGNKTMWSDLIFCNH